MKPRTVLYIVALIFILIFTLANWTVIASRTEFNLLVAKVNAPLGVLVALLAGIVFVIDSIWHALHRSAWTRERRLLLQENGQLRLRAEQVELSRIKELRDFVEHETAAIRSQLDRLLAMPPGTSPAVRP